MRADLLEAYVGYYEEDAEARRDYDVVVAAEVAKGDEACAVPTFESWLEDWCLAKIRADEPKRHLQIYLSWNGILGYTDTIWDLAHGAGLR